MRLDATAPLAGRPARLIRSFLRRVTERGPWTVPDAARVLGSPVAAAERTVSALVVAGLVEPVPPARMQPPLPIRLEAAYAVTARGAALAEATFVRPMLRATGERKLAEFLRRLHRVNQDTRYHYTVERAVLFGAMLGDDPRVLEVAVAVRLVSRHEGEARRRQLEETCIREALALGRRFGSLAEMLAWPRREVMLFLQNGCRGLSLHDLEDPALRDIPVRQIHPIAELPHRRTIARPPSHSRRRALR